ncbi:MAG: GatB/YqeY domain-containing protein [Actinobacteria bacterium]|nr:GatB/YqeY domain-containing protein [Actinomycetota bacterium]
MLIEKMKQDQLAFRKSGDKEKVSTLTFILGVLTQKKKSTDEDAVALIKSIIKSIRTSLEGHKEKLKQYEEEIAFMESYLPAQLSEEEIRDFLDTAVQNGDKITMSFMGKINMVAKAAGKTVDNQLAKTILQAYLV